MPRQIIRGLLFCRRIVTAALLPSLALASGGSGVGAGTSLPATARIGDSCDIPAKQQYIGYAGQAKDRATYSCPPGEETTEMLEFTNPDGSKSKRPHTSIHHKDARCAQTNYEPYRDQLVKMIQDSQTRVGNASEARGVVTELEKPGSSKLYCKEVSSPIQYENAILITSFLPWEDYPSNVSIDVAEGVVQRLRAVLGPKWQINNCILPVVYDASITEMVRCYNEMALPPKFVLSLGQAEHISSSYDGMADVYVLPPANAPASQYRLRIDLGADNAVTTRGLQGKTTFCLERDTQGRCLKTEQSRLGYADYFKQTRVGRIWKGSPDQLAASYPYMEMFCALPPEEQGAIDFRPNSDDYLCNYTSFQFMELIRLALPAEKRPSYGFFKVPIVSKEHGSGGNIGPLVDRLSKMILTATQTPKGALRNDRLSYGNRLTRYTPSPLRDTVHLGGKLWFDYQKWRTWSPSEHDKIAAEKATAQGDKDYQARRRPDKPDLPTENGPFRKDPNADIYSMTTSQGDRITYFMETNSYKVETRYGYYEADQNGEAQVIYRDEGRIAQVRDAGQATEIPPYYLPENDCERRFLEKIVNRGRSSLEVRSLRQDGGSSNALPSVNYSKNPGAVVTSQPAKTQVQIRREMQERGSSGGSAAAPVSPTGTKCPRKPEPLEGFAANQPTAQGRYERELQEHNQCMHAKK